mgnify:CR=1 FL=1
MHQYNLIQYKLKKLQEMTNKLSQKIETFNFEEQELIYRVFRNLYPDKLSSMSDKHIAKQILEKLTWLEPEN